MAGEDDNQDGRPEAPASPPEDKTVFAPSPFTSPPPARPAPTPFDEPAVQPEESKTVPPKSAPPAASQSAVEAAPAPQPQMTAPPPSTSFTPMAPRAEGGGIQIGDVLNHMFEVKRFIARGGMGEVFEGVNVASDERVAIKVMLPQLAADPNVQAMFRKEAKTLTKLAHPALVQYRVMATEPQLGVLYIVTEYIDSKNLEDALPQIKATPAQLLALTRRLADGLRVAHGLGAIHRDISPDNVLLEDGELTKARIIDFGIAKDLDPTSKTIVGDGFAGKLNYVAPEQLGDFDRSVGPWTDIYSLALVVLAVANGKPVNMGGTLVDAVDKRRQGPDLSGAPAELHPLLTAMLKPNPQERLRSMDEVIAFIDKGGAATPTPEPARAPTKAKDRPAPKARPEPAAKPAGSTPSAPAIDPKLLMFGGGGAVVVLLLIVGGVMMFGGKHPAKTTGATAVPAVTASSSPVDAARATVTATLPGIDCAWLDVTNIQPAGDGVDVSLRGVAADTIAVQAAIVKAMSAKGLTLHALSTDDVAPMEQGPACGLLNAYSAIRATGGSLMSAAQTKTEMDIRPDAPANQKNIKLARPVITFYVDPQTPDVAMYGIETSGAIGRLPISKAQLSDPAFIQSFNIQAEGNGLYRFVPNQDTPGWGGLLLLKGKGPFPDNIVMPPPAARGAAWQQTFRQMAAQNGWRSEMLWINAVDETPN